MTRPAPGDEITRAARRAWDAVPDYLRQPKQQTRTGSLRVEFSDRRTT